MYKANQSKSSNFSSTGAIIFCVFLMGQVFMPVLPHSITYLSPLKRNDHYGKMSHFMDTI